MPVRLINPQRLSPDRLSPCHDNLHYSVRRYYIDEFFQRHAMALEPGSRIVDVGGLKGRKRGQFDIGKLDLNVTYVNTSPKAEPDILADASRIPLPTGKADAVILAEVVEHLPDPQPAFLEAARLLRPGGVLLATAPFMFRVHPDPLDVGRYAPDWWGQSLDRAGFVDILLERQGMMFSVIAEIARGWAKHLSDSGELGPTAREAAPEFVRFAREQAMAWEARESVAATEYYQSYATGFGVRAVRA